MAYKIDPPVLAEVCGEVLELPLESGELFTALIEKLSNTYPDLIENKQRRWIGTYDLEGDQIAPTTYVPGDLSHLGKGQARGLDIKPGSWHLEYGRGPNITAMPFGLADTLVSSVELKPLMLTTSEYAKLLANGLRKRRQTR